VNKWVRILRGELLVWGLGRGMRKGGEAPAVGISVHSSVTGFGAVEKGEILLEVIEGDVAAWELRT